MSETSNELSNLKKKEPPTLIGLLSRADVQQKIAGLVGDRKAAFISTLLAVQNGNDALKKCTPLSILSAAIGAAVLNFTVDPNLGFAYIVPYGNKAQLQVGYKGFVQLALRSGTYKTITANEVYEGEIVSFNRFLGTFEFGERKSDKVVGFFAYFKLLSGSEFSNYMTVQQVTDHAAKYSKAYQYKKKDSPWFTNFNQMGKKTALKSLLTKFGELSVDLQNAVSLDQSEVSPAIIEGEVIDINTVVVYPDGNDYVEEPAEILPEKEKQGGIF